MTLQETELAAGNLNDSACRPVRGRRAGAAPVIDTEYWLTEEAALFVSARSDTKRGAEVLNALILAFTGAREAGGRVNRVLELCFANEPRQVRRMFSGLIGALLNLRGEEPGRQAPAWAPGLAEMVYRWAFGSESQKLRRELNPEPGFNAVDYGFCTDDGLRRLERILQAGEDYAVDSHSWHDWRAKMERRFGDKPVQLEIYVPLRGLR